MRIQTITEQLGGQFIASADGGITLDVDIVRLAPLPHAQSGEAAFLVNPKYRPDLAQTHASLVLLESSMRDHVPAHTAALVVADAYAAFARLSQLLAPAATSTGERHASAVIDDTAQLDATVEVGAHAVIGARVKIGAGARILAGAVIEDDCVLGENCLIHPNVVLYHGVVLGARVEIHGGSVIGADGFGNAWDKQQRKWIKIMQTGSVRIGQDTEIGANSMIDRGALEDTVIGQGVRIDNQVQIGHNCVIGDHTAIAACAGISGSVTIGKYCIIGGAAMFVGHISIAEGTFIGGGTAVTRSITEPGHYATCYPLQTHKEWTKNAIHVRHLNQMNQRLKALEHTLSGSLNEDAST